MNLQPFNLDEDIQKKIDTKTKPLGALGDLESIAFKIAKLQNSLMPRLLNPSILVFAGDHGLAKTGVSAFPQDVTWQMVLNFLNKGAAINVFAQQNDIELKIIDAGVNFIFSKENELIDQKIGLGTKNCLEEDAMTEQECLEAIEKGKESVRLIDREGSNVVGCGEMGIGNTSSASLLVSLLCKADIEECVGRGTGLNDEQLENKVKILSQVIKRFGDRERTPVEVLKAVGGFEIAQMAGAFLEAAELGMVILVDGFIASSAFLVAGMINPKISENAVFCHKSHEKGHALILNHFKAKPILDMNLRLGEGTGCALAYPIVKSAVAFFNDMASFESANVSSGN
ncbi:nicotinate-nucleotide--dimethylbenzimidazole phosphoribosyltransferase [Aureibacter tunicatorum]|uniref:Nicotinate-nucleotide--dimethylbenzimidazole phosphoribosyltransferase n=1 Tax=Aureibacter tunicatorum TaxID=866807 RepID=A0AAE3XKQ9_9BACT|nr:nicotinate-nucleotide--dimethylbenzimidazole phosphoribosyltransferase [Aureibacter tunicatorum]MDR6239631.1 nicotinate-nucleotide--dimethylbenzimidazole phosphoribosyltransferase [Aureibacter tunicatorum]BDD04107.1 nicotinate-nucleotide--dimethylbenzimidazole phosphoribosyltransferase [Aureibacter tunicatorum]